MKLDERETYLMKLTCANKLPRILAFCRNMKNFPNHGGTYRFKRRFIKYSEER